MDFVEIGIQLKEARQARGISQLMLGEMTRLSPSTVSNVEKGKPPTKNTLETLAAALELELDIPVDLPPPTNEGRLGNDPELVRIGKMIRARRVEWNMTQCEASRKAGVHYKTMSLAERGLPTSQESLRRIGAAFRLTFDIPEWLSKFGSRLGAYVTSENNLKRWDFTPGGKYNIGGMMFRFMRKVGPHHLFRHIGGGWLTCWTDAQLVGVEVKE